MISAPSDTASAESVGLSPSSSVPRACPRSRISRLMKYHQNHE